VHYVLAAAADPAAGSVAEAKLLASGRSGLIRVFAAGDGSIYELPHPTPILTGPAVSAITFQNHSEIDGWVARAGTYRLRVRFTPVWTLRPGALCLAPGVNGMTTLHVSHSGAFSLQAAEGPGEVLSIAFPDKRNRAATCSTSLPAGRTGTRDARE
jgi:hypothetical protein